MNVLLSAWRSLAFSLCLLASAVLLLSSCQDGVSPEHPTPGIVSLSPAVVDQGSPSLTLTVMGSDFISASTVRFNGSVRPTEFVSSTELHATLNPSDFAQLGPAMVTVSTPAPGGGVSNAVQLLVRIRTNPVPVITGFSPNPVVAGSTGVMLTVTGTGFVEQSTVLIGLHGDLPRQTTYISETQLEAALTDAEVARGDSLLIRVYNPTPGGGVSNSTHVEVRAPAPSLTSLETTETTAGQTSFTLRVSGSGFVGNSQVRFGDVPHPAKLVSAGVLEATLTESDLRAAGTYPVIVFNPAPGGGMSNALDFELVNPVPEITLLPSQGARAGGSGFDLMIHGRGFVQGSAVRWNGADLPTQYVSSTRVSATISAADVAAAQSVQISVHNPAPGGGASTSALFVVRTVSAATATSIQTLSLSARDLLYNPQTDLIYVSVPGGAASHGNNIVAVDPNTAAIAGSEFVGSEPTRLARSDDGAFLYVGLDGSNSIRRVEMATLTPGLHWQLPGGEVARALEVVPGQPGVLAVSRHQPGSSPSLRGVTIYDDGVARPTSSPGHTGGSRIAFLESPAVLYGFNDSSTGFQFFTIAIEPSGARHLAATGGLISGFYTRIVGAAGRIYGTDGSVVDAERRVRLGTFGQNSTALAVDPTTGRVFMVAGTGIQVYDMNTYQLLGTIPVGDLNFAHPASSQPRLVRWGSDGLAFVDQEKLYLIRSPIVAP